MTSCHLIIVLVKVGSTLFLDQADNHQQANLIVYQRLIEKLIYLSCRTHPNITFVIGQLSCHNSDLWIRYLYITKQVLCYLKRTITLGIKWGNNPKDHWSSGKYRKLGIVEYADSSYASDLKDKKSKSITEYCFFLIEQSSLGIVNNNVQSQHLS